VPTGLSANVISSSQVNLHWTASSDPDDAVGQISYGCYRNGVRFTTTAPGTTSCNDTGLSASTTYTYTVSAQDAAGNSSAPSAGVQATTQAPPVPVISSFTANPPSVVSGQSSTLVWSVSNASSLTVDNGVGNVTDTSSFSVHPSVTTVYQLTATNSFGSVTAQTTLTITADTVSPTAPDNLTATSVGMSQIDLSWNASTDNVSVTGYIIDRCQGTGCTSFTQIATPSGIGTSYSDMGLTAGVVYSYRVKASDGAGNLSSYSNISSATIPAATSGLVSGYAFNEGIGTSAFDSSGNGLTATLTNGASWITGKYGNAVSLNGANQYLDLGNPAALQMTGSMTISGWIRASSFPVDDAAIMSKRSNAEVGYQLDATVDQGPRTIGFKLTSSSGEFMARYGATALSTNTWYHVAGVYDATALTLNVYLNGQLDNGTLIGTVTSSQQNSMQNVSIGQRTGIPGSFNFAGSLDEVRIYSRALTPGEIQADMSTPIGSAADTQAPTAPSNLAATATSPTQINLGWTASSDNSGVTGYLIERCQGAGCTTFIQIASPSGTATTYSDTGLSSSSTYRYQVRATDAASNSSPYSNIANATTTVLDTQAPTAPSALTANAVSGRKINLTWMASTDNIGVTGYLVERCQSAGCTTFTQVAALSGTGTSYSDTGLIPASTYRYQIRATDANSNMSPYSEIADATTQDVSTPVFPLKVSTNQRYLVDQNDQPFLIVGDSPQGLITDLSTADADTYFANRASHGFNAVQIHIFTKETFGGRSDYSTYDGITPFTTPGDVTTPRESYFARVDAILNLAAQHGIVVFLTAAETSDSLDLFRNNGITNSRNFGQYLGNRYKNFDNVVWDYGNDFQTWSTPSDNAVILAVAAGIKDNDSRHLHTIWLNYNVSASRDSSDWAQMVDLDFAYTYFPTYAKILSEYALSPSMPVYLGESNYEEESLRGYLTTPEIIRRQEYWALTSGATGSFYGNYWTWPLRTGWQSHYDSPGAAQMPFLRNLFESRSWWTLIPDSSHEVLTAGYGTYEAFGSIASNDFATAALASDSSFMIAYLPTIRTVTVEMSKFTGPVTARWFDPSNGAYSTIAGSPLPNTGRRDFTPPNNNNDGNGDWVLVLETTPAR
jgi:chitodextrinase